MSIKHKLLILAAVGLLLVGAMSIFTVTERERAIRLQLGKIVSSDYEPGLHWKVPFVQNVLKFDARVRTLDADPELYLTVEKKNVKVDSFVMWRIANVERFYTATSGNMRRAADRLSALIQKRFKDEFGTRTIAQVVSGERDAIMSNVAGAVEEQAGELGIHIVDVRVKRIDLPEAVSNSVFQRMSAEREEVAKRFRSEGEEEARKIRARAERQREVILAQARRKSQEIRGNGDAGAAEIYANAYNQDPGFYAFYRSLDAYRNTFRDSSDILLLQPNSEFFQYFKQADGSP